ncbi:MULTISPECIES: hypothetical protein [unclassified Serratia (in: enterobacteria)]|uniref:hypothetical protein n=1 Tax=unclassified Serratia (in: enterobacteria) TaxID=2647522 RepID=UPI0030766F94
MTISIAPYEHSDLCHGNTWTVTDLDALAQQIALVALGQSRHVQRILAGTSLVARPATDNAVLGAIRLLTVPPDEKPWHRDGWMFQVISWIAAHRGTPSGIIRAPHMIHAEKGFDGLQLKIDVQTGVVTAAIIFEDKATDAPRNTIREDVWPEFAALEAGERENLLTAEVTSLLQTQPDLDPDLAIENIIWGSVRHYRISITVCTTHNSDTGRQRLFKEFDAVVPGDNQRRQGETFYVQNLRPWMQALAEKAIALIQG